MDARHINAFLESTRAVFGTMLKVPVAFEKPEISTEPHTSDVSGVIGLSGDIAGSVIVGFCKLSSVQIASALAGTRLEFGSADFADAIGEIANMIAGGAKSRLDGMDVKISCPTVVLAPNHDIRTPSGAASICIPCTTPAGRFTIDVAFQRSAGGAHRSRGGSAATPPAVAGISA